MNRFIFFLLAMILSVALQAQSAFYITNSDNRGYERPVAQTHQVSLLNPWVGATVSYNLNADQPVNDNFLFNARVLYTAIQGDRFSVPVVTSIGADGIDILDPGSGINFGVYPYYLLKNSGQVMVILHGGFGYKVLLSGANDDNTVPQQFRLLAGVEFAHYSDSQALPTTVSINPVLCINTNSGLSNTYALETDLIIPLGSGLGALISGQIPFNEDFDGSFKIGIVVNSQL